MDRCVKYIWTGCYFFTGTPQKIYTHFLHNLRNFLPQRSRTFHVLPVVILLTVLYRLLETDDFKMVCSSATKLLLKEVGQLHSTEVRLFVRIEGGRDVLHHWHARCRQKLDNAAGCKVGAAFQATTSLELFPGVEDSQQFTNQFIQLAEGGDGTLLLHQLKSKGHHVHLECWVNEIHTSVIVLVTG